MTDMSRSSALLESRAPARRLSKYRLIRLLGRGATARVFLARHLFLRRLVALKLLTWDLGEWPEPDLAIFEETAAAAAGLNHPNIVTIHDIDEVDAQPFIVMEYVPGRTLQQLLDRRGRLSPAVTAAVGRQVALGLAHAHKRGVIHCDIKPSNLLLAPDGRIKIADFGLAQAIHRTSAVVLDGMIGGTPAYMAPEHAEGARPDARSDLFALGVTLFETLTGRRPFDVPSHFALRSPRALRNLLSSSLPPGSGPLAGVIESLLQPRPEDRCASAVALLEDLRGPAPGKLRSLRSRRPERIA